MLDKNEEIDDRVKELEDKLEALRIELEESFEDIDDLRETVENPAGEGFTEVQHGTHHFQVHWIKPSETETYPNCEDIDSLEKARIAFKEAAIKRDTSSHLRPVNQGDVLFLMCNTNTVESESESESEPQPVCSYIGMCAKVDFRTQLENPDSSLNLTEIQQADGDTYREFFAWDSCGAGAGDGGDGCPPGSSVSVVGSVSSSGGSPTDFTKVLSKQDSNLPVLTHTLDKLKALSLTKNTNGSSQDDAEDFLAFGEGISQCDNGCSGLFVNLKKFSATQEKYDLSAAVSLSTLKLTPNEFVPTPLQKSTTTLTISSSTIGSDPCGSLSSLGGSSSESALSQLSKGASEDPEVIYDPSVEDAGTSSVSIGSTDLFTGVKGSDIDGVSNLFLPAIPEDACPVSTVVSIASEKTSIRVSLGACTNDSQEVTVFVRPFTRQYTFNCGLLVAVGDETLGNNPERSHSFSMPCGDNSGNFGCQEIEICDGSGTKTITIPTYIDEDGNTLETCPSEG